MLRSSTWEMSWAFCIDCPERSEISEVELIQVHGVRLLGVSEIVADGLIVAWLLAFVTWFVLLWFIQRKARAGELDEDWFQRAVHHNALSSDIHS